MKKFTDFITSLRFKLCNLLNTNAFQTPNERAFFRELQEIMDNMANEQSNKH